MRVSQLMMRVRRKLRRKLLEWVFLPQRLRNEGRLRRLRQRLGDSPSVLTPVETGGVNALAATMPAPGETESHPDYESVIERVYRNLLRIGDVAVDVGANFGAHTLGMAESVYPTGCVIAFEPLPVGRAEIERLLGRAARGAYRRVVCLSPLAISNRSGQTEFTYAVDVPGWSGLVALEQYARPVQLLKIPARVARLDDMLADLPRCRFLKIDVEGGEYDVVRGGEAFIRRTRPVVVFEFGVHSCASYNVRPIEMARFWEGLNYRIVDVRGRLLSVDQFAQSAVRQEVWDYFAIPAEDSEILVRVQHYCQNP